jgi:hypothetical protein
MITVEGQFEAFDRGLDHSFRLYLTKIRTEVNI